MIADDVKTKHREGLETLRTLIHQADGQIDTTVPKEHGIAAARHWTFRDGSKLSATEAQLDSLFSFELGVDPKIAEPVVVVETEGDRQLRCAREQAVCNATPREAERESLEAQQMARELADEQRLVKERLLSDPADNPATVVDESKDGDNTYRRRTRL